MSGNGGTLLKEDNPVAPMDSNETSALETDNAQPDNG